MQEAWILETADRLWVAEHVTKEKVIANYPFQLNSDGIMSIQIDTYMLDTDPFFRKFILDPDSYLVQNILYYKRYNLAINSQSIVFNFSRVYI